LVRVIEHQRHHKAPIRQLSVEELIRIVGEKAAVHLMRNHARARVPTLLPLPLPETEESHHPRLAPRL
jgi:hypothetical protein